MKRKEKIQKIYKNIINAIKNIIDVIHILNAFYPQALAPVPVVVLIYSDQKPHARAVGEVGVSEVLKAPDLDFSLQSEITAIEPYLLVKKANQAQNPPSMAD